MVMNLKKKNKTAWTLPLVLQSCIQESILQEYVYIDVCAPRLTEVLFVIANILEAVLISTN